MKEIAYGQYELEYPDCTDEAKENFYNFFLNHFYYSKPANSKKQIEYAEKLLNDARSGKLNIKLIVIDSLIGHFRAEYFELNEMAKRQKKLNRYIHIMDEIATIKNACVIYTNQAMANISAASRGMPNAPPLHTGGHVVGHGVNNRIYFRKGKDGAKIVKLMDSAQSEKKDASFIIDITGVLPQG